MREMRGSVPQGGTELLKCHAFMIFSLKLVEIEYEAAMSKALLAENHPFFFKNNSISAGMRGTLHRYGAGAKYSFLNIS